MELEPPREDIRQVTPFPAARFCANTAARGTHEQRAQHGASPVVRTTRADSIRQLAKQGGNAAEADGELFGTLGRAAT